MPLNPDPVSHCRSPLHSLTTPSPLAFASLAFSSPTVKLPVPSHSPPSEPSPASHPIRADERQRHRRRLLGRAPRSGPLQWWLRLQLFLALGFPAPFLGRRVPVEEPLGEE
jgi:hypothetical protein